MAQKRNKRFHRRSKSKLSDASLSLCLYPTSSLNPSKGDIIGFSSDLSKDKSEQTSSSDRMHKTRLPRPFRRDFSKERSPDFSSRVPSSPVSFEEDMKRGRPRKNQHRQ